MNTIKLFIYVFFLSALLTVGSALGLGVAEKGLEKFNDWKERKRAEREKFE